MSAQLQQAWHPTAARAVESKPGRGDWSVEVLVLLTTGLLVAFANLPFWHAALASRDLAEATTWQFTLCTAFLLVWLHAVPVLLLATRATVRPMLALLIIGSVMAQYVMRQYGVVLDPSMLRNAFRTDLREASELITPWLLVNLAIALAATALLWRVPLRKMPVRKALGLRLLTVAGLTLLGVAALLAVFQDLSSTMRNHKELRYRITPGNAIYSTASVLAADVRGARRVAEPLQPIHKTGAAFAGKPRLLVLMVGETARAKNFSLNGYARVTNPELARQPVINFADTSACGTSTEVSLPCMFSSYGRANYDEDRIRASESLVQLLARSGMRVVWLDNQSGCKNVCAGVEFKNVSDGADPTLCPQGRCFDGALIQELGRVIDGDSDNPGKDTVVVLHQLGNHGPAYSKRYPEQFARFKPECTKSELRECSNEEIVNSYDNAILYTDHLIAETISLLAKQQEKFDVGLIYLSDHGESLGEKGLYLHGMPYAIAPREQLGVPMLWWLGGSGVRGWSGVNEDCLRRRAMRPAHHDNLYHSVLGLMGLDTSRYVPSSDLISTCRRSGGTS